ncbi:calponin homology domain-containing protein [Pilobolus umbonatus]|nr:calponin homology domain-containing protein [Pilobolus umbonatus]
MGESRTELLAWVNDLLQLNYTKVEQAGTGAAYCQIMDSIYNDVHMTKVKFDTKHEYEYVGNYKILQHALDKHKIDKLVPVDKLLKCKFQDNLEFMQWLKRYWDQNFPGGAYDAVQRRKGGGPVKSTARVGATRKPVATTPAVSAARTTPNRPVRTVKDASPAVSELNRQVNELKVTVDGLEKERDFYFAKLREIEILVQENLDAAEMNQVDEHELACVRDIQAILYRTEEGFEVPPEDELDAEAYDDETF